MVMSDKAECLITEGRTFRTLLWLLKTSSTIRLEIIIPQICKISGYCGIDNEDSSLLEHDTTENGIWVPMLCHNQYCNFQGSQMRLP